MSDIDLLVDCWNCDDKIDCAFSTVRSYKKLRNDTCPTFKIVRKEG